MSTTALRDAVSTAIARTDSAWRLNRARAMDATRNAVLAAVEPVVADAVQEAERRGRDAGAREALAHDAKIQETALRLAREDARREALHEAADMLARHGHKSAITRVRNMAAVPAEVAP